MIFAMILTSEEHFPEPCLVADKPSPYSKPIPVRLLRKSDCGVQLVSNEEGVTVTTDPRDNSTIITTIRPCKLYLTPNLPEKPGFSVESIKVTPLGDDKVKVHYARESKGGEGNVEEWKPWDPSIKLNV